MFLHASIAKARAAAAATSKSRSAAVLTSVIGQSAAPRPLAPAKAPLLQHCASSSSSSLVSSHASQYCDALSDPSNIGGSASSGSSQQQLQQVRWLRKPPTNVPPAYRPYDSDDEDDGGSSGRGGSSRGGGFRGSGGRRHHRGGRGAGGGKWRTAAAARRASVSGGYGKGRRGGGGGSGHQQHNQNHHQHRKKVVRSSRRTASGVDGKAPSAASSSGGHVKKYNNSSSYRRSRGMRDIDELLAMETDLGNVLDRYEAELRSSYNDGNGGDDGIIFDDLDTVQRKRKEDAERRRGDVAGSTSQGVDGGASLTPPPPAATIAAIESTESTYKEAATLLRKLVSGWSAVRLYSHGDQLADRTSVLLKTGSGSGESGSGESGSGSGNGSGNVGDAAPPAPPAASNSPAQRALAFLNQLEDLRVEREDAVRRAVERERRERAEAGKRQAEEKAGLGAGTLLGTVGRLFGFGQAEEEQKEEEASTSAFARSASDLDECNLDGITAHKSPEYVGERHLYRQVMKSSIHWYRAASSSDGIGEDDDDEIDVGGEKEDVGTDGSKPTTSQQNLGQHLHSILNKMTKRADMGNPNVRPNSELYLIVIKVFSQVGTLNSANTAHRLLTKLEKTTQKVEASGGNGEGLSETSSRPKLHAYHLVLQAYRNAVTNSSRKKHVRTAVARAERLLAEDLQSADRGYGKGKGNIDMPVPNVITYNLLIDTLSRAGHGVIPNLCDRVDSILEQMIGRSGLLDLIGEEEVAGKRSDAEDGASKPLSQKIEPDMFTKHLALGIYSSKAGDRRYAERAKHLLASMEQARTRKLESATAGGSDGYNSRRRGTTDRGWNDGDFFMTLPNRDSYNAVLRSLLHSNVVSTGNISTSSNDSTYEDDAKYATGLLDSMVRHESCHPTKFTYNYVLRLWAKSGAKDAGLRAEDILSRMEVRSAICSFAKGGGGASRLSGVEIPKPDTLCYQNAIACWGVSAAKSYPGAAKRAMLLFDKMEAQCSPGYETSFGSDDERNYLLDHIYNESVRPNRFVFTTLIMSCALTQLEDDKADALRIAFDAYNRMIDRGLIPTSETYANLLKTCKRLLTDDSQRDQRNQLSQTVFEAARDNGQVNAHLLNCLRDVNPVLYESYQT